MQSTPVPMRSTHIFRIQLFWWTTFASTANTYLPFEIWNAVCCGARRQKQKSTTDLQGIRIYRRWILPRNTDKREMEIKKTPRNMKWIETFKWYTYCNRSACRRTEQCCVHVPVFARRFRRQTCFFCKQTFCKSFWFMNSTFHISALSEHNFPNPCSGSSSSSTDNSRRYLSYAALSIDCDNDDKRIMY